MAIVPKSIRFCPTWLADVSFFITLFWKKIHCGVDPTLDSGNCFDFDPAGNKVAKQLRLLEE